MYCNSFRHNDGQHLLRRVPATVQVWSLCTRLWALDTRQLTTDERLSKVVNSSTTTEISLTSLPLHYSINTTTTTTTTTTTVLRPFVRDYLGEPVPEETFPTNIHTCMTCTDYRIRATSTNKWPHHFVHASLYTTTLLVYPLVTTSTLYWITINTSASDNDFTSSWRHVEKLSSYQNRVQYLCKHPQRWITMQ